VRILPAAIRQQTVKNQRINAMLTDGAEGPRLTVCSFRRRFPQAGTAIGSDPRRFNAIIVLGVAKENETSGNRPETCLR